MPTSTTKRPAAEKKKSAAKKKVAAKKADNASRASIGKSLDRNAKTAKKKAGQLRVAGGFKKAASKDLQRSHPNVPFVQRAAKSLSKDADLAKKRAKNNDRLRTTAKVASKTLGKKK